MLQLRGVQAGSCKGWLHLVGPPHADFARLALGVFALVDKLVADPAVGLAHQAVHRVARQCLKGPDLVPAVERRVVSAELGEGLAMGGRRGEGRGLAKGEGVAKGEAWRRGKAWRRERPGKGGVTGEAWLRER